MAVVKPVELFNGKQKFAKENEFASQASIG
jgi:hypothetical protein